MKNPLLALLLSTSFGALAQNPIDFSGKWTGSVQVPLSDDLLGEYNFKQEGFVITGFVKLLKQNKKDSSKCTVSGTIKNGVLQFKGVEYEYNTMNNCLAFSELKYSRENGLEKLTGKWKGDFSFSTCPPGTTGKIELAKVTTLGPVAVETRTTSTVKLDVDDKTGMALMEELKKRKYYALLIGVSEYTDDGIQDLDHPVLDATEIQAVLQTHYTFEKENTIFLANPTRTKIIESFDLLSEKITERDHLLIFYAGHGIWDERIQQGFWLPSDSKPNSKAQWLSNSTLCDYVGGIRSKHTLLITDACFSGSIFKERSVTFANSKAVLEMYKLPSRKAMTSGALKTVPDKSVFVDYLAKYLLNNDQPLLPAEELFRQFKIAVINNSPNGQVPQYGPIGQAGDEGGDFIFLKRMDNGQK